MSTWKILSSKIFYGFLVPIPWKKSYPITFFLPYFFISFFQKKLRQGNIFSENPMRNLAKVFLWMSLKFNKKSQEKRHIWIHHLRLPRRFGMNQPRPAALWVQALAPGWPACQFGLSGFKPARFAWDFLGTSLSWQVSEYPKWPKTNSCLVVIFWMFVLRAWTKRYYYQFIFELFHFMVMKWGSRFFLNKQLVFLEEWNVIRVLKRPEVYNYTL